MSLCNENSLTLPLPFPYRIMQNLKLERCSRSSDNLGSIEKNLRRWGRRAQNNRGLSAVSRPQFPYDENIGLIISSGVRCICTYRSRWNGKAAKSDGCVVSAHAVTVDNRPREWTRIVSPLDGPTEFKASSARALARAEIADRLSEKCVLHRAKDNWLLESHPVRADQTARECA